MKARFSDVEAAPEDIAGLELAWRQIATRFEPARYRGWLLYDAEHSRARTLVVSHRPMPGEEPIELDLADWQRAGQGAPRPIDEMEVSVTIEPREFARAACARIIDAAAGPGRLEALIGNWDRLGETYPEQPGFAGALLGTAANTGVMRSVTFWTDVASRDGHAASGKLARSVDSMRAYFRADPIRSLWEVCHDAGRERIGA